MALASAASVALGAVVVAPFPSCLFARSVLPALVVSLAVVVFAFEISVSLFGPGLALRACLSHRPSLVLYLVPVECSPGVFASFHRLRLRWLPTLIGLRP